MPEAITLHPNQANGYPAVLPAPNGSFKSGYDWLLSGGQYYPRLRDISGNAFGIQGWLPSTVGSQVIAFTRTVTLTSAAAAAGVTVIADADVLAGYTPYVTGFYGKVNGATNWATTATVTLQDSNGTPVPFLIFAVAGMTGNSTRFPGSTNITYSDAYILHGGGTAGKGLVLIGDANGTGSDFTLTVIGYYRRTS